MSTDLNPTIDVRDGEQLDLDVIDACLKAGVENLQGLPGRAGYPGLLGPGRRPARAGHDDRAAQ